MAGDVSAFISGSTLYINGDAEDNQIEISQLSDGSVQIQKAEEFNPFFPTGYWTTSGFVYSNAYYTLVNGQHSDTISGAFSHIRINMNAGDDSVDMDDVTVLWDTSVYLGAGSDTLEIHDSSFGDDLRIWTETAYGAGSRDVVKINNSEVGDRATHGDLVINGTSSPETVHLNNVTVSDDLNMRLTWNGEQDYAFVYGATEVNGNSSGGYARIDSNYLYVDRLDVDGDGDFRRVNRLYAYNSVFYEDLRVDGTFDGDTMTLSNMTVGDVAEVEGLDGDDTIRIYGNRGFVLKGGDGDDRLEGGNGNDVLYGDAGDDTLLGKAGVDQIFGGDDNDWLEAGSAWELAEGGNGVDWNAHRYVIDGLSATDVNQTSSSRCVVLAAMAGAVDRGVDLAGRITYLGDFQYRVKLFDANNGGWVNVEVTFDGELARRTNGALADTAPEDFDDGVAEFWPLLYQRAYAQHFYGIDPTDGEAMAILDGEAFHHRAMTAVTGWNVSQNDWWLPGVGYLKTDQMLFNELSDAIADGELINVGGTGHAYYVKDVFNSGGQLKARLYNPWGSDAVHTPSSTNPDAGELKFEADGSNDGFITVMISDMRKNFHRYFRTNH